MYAIERFHCISSSLICASKQHMNTQFYKHRSYKVSEDLCISCIYSSLDCTNEAAENMVCFPYFDNLYVPDEVFVYKYRNYSKNYRSSFYIMDSCKWLSFNNTLSIEMKYIDIDILDIFIHVNLLKGKM